MPDTRERQVTGDFWFTGEDGATYVISIYEPGLVRIRYWKGGSSDPAMRQTWSIADLDGERPIEGFDRQQLDQMNGQPRFSRPEYQMTVQPGAPVHLNTGVLTLVVTTDPFAISWSDTALLAADHPLIGYHTDQRTGAVAHTLIRTADEHYYGFGEASGPLDKHARFIRMRNTDAFGYDAETGSPLYKHIPFYITLRDRPGNPDSTAAFGLFYDTPYDCEFDLGSEIDNYYGDYRVFRAAGGDLDYYFLYGPTIEHVIETYTSLTGRIPLPPRWTLGYLGSAMRYTEAPNAQEMLGQFIEKCKQNTIPCSGFHLSSGYTLGADGKRYVFTWNRQRVPTPEQMTKTFHDAGMRLAANIKPAMLTTHPRYAEAASLFIRDSEADKPDLAPFWGGYGAHLDFTNPATIAWWKQNVKAQLLDYGIDSTWNDNNEFNLRNDAARCHGFGHETPIMASRPVQTLLMVMASYQAQREHAPERRPWLLTRAGTAGIQHYAATWTGDNRTSWKTLRYNVPMGLGLSLSGFANVGHDVGGFVGDPPDPELFLRWVQNGIFHPRFCIHSWRDDEGENAPWMYPEILPQVREVFDFRYRLIPYLYSLLWEASQTGHPVIRPMVYHFQDDRNCHQQSFEFMLGPFLLVASVLDPGDRVRRVYLPRGTGWYDWYTGSYYEGGQAVSLDAPLDRIPLLVREGGIIPLDVDGTRYVYAFPHRSIGEGAFRLYEDDGNTANYQQGQYQIINLHVRADAATVHLEADGDATWVLPPTETRQIVS